jgi:enamine deaminase RidA (YjgF/YER057c/UK114 family)
MKTRLEYLSFATGAVPATVHGARFPGASGVDEFHFVARPTRAADFATQLAWVTAAYRNAVELAGLRGAPARFRRLFCSDLVNQAAHLAATEYAADSWVGQPPMPPVKVALWAYHVSDPAAALMQHWTTRLCDGTARTPYDQTRTVFEKYDAWLRARGMTLADHVIRTWLFVRDVDANYGELVAARRDFFATRGLTASTHFIASTGIEGQPADPSVKVVLDAYALAGVRREQVQFLRALDHLCPTARYGVTFERATAVAYRDRRHVFVSGTASIDRDGQIVHPGDVRRQLDRALENMAALLRQADATLADVGVFIVYVRDPADHELAWREMRARIGNAPLEVIVAPVCRPGWLIEVEGHAIVPFTAPELPAF